MSTTQKVAILWDNDGVLVDTEPLFYAAARQVFADMGREISWQDYQHVALNVGGSIFQQLDQEGVAQDEIDRLKQERDRIYSKLIGQSETLEIPGMRELLDDMQEKVRMGIVTNSLRSHFLQLHKKTKFLEMVEFAVAREDYERGKPHPDGYQMGLQQLGLPPEQVIAIEDSQRGLAAATSAGIDTIVITNPTTQGLDFSRALYVTDSVADLRLYLEGIFS